MSLVNEESWDTRRAKIAKLLRNAPRSASEISRVLGISIADVLEDLRHIARSPKYGELRIHPARCRKCGYVFKAEIKIPKKCPRCKSTWIEEPLFILR